MTTVQDVIQWMEISNVPWAQVVVAAFEHLNHGWWNSNDIEAVRQAESNFINVTRRMELPREELLWLLSTLSEDHYYWGLYEKKPFLIEICLLILLNHVPKLGDSDVPDMALLDTVVTLATMSCSLHPNWLRNHIPTSRYELPWFFQSVQNPTIFANWFKDTPSDYHKQLISLLFLVLSSFIRRDSYPLAIRYLTVITARGDLPLYTSALTAIAPVIGEDRLSTISRMLMAPQTQKLIPIIPHSTIYGAHNFQDELLKNYDLQLGANDNPDPNFLAIMFMLSKHVPSDTIEGLKNMIPDLKNLWLRLAARLVA